MTTDDSELSALIAGCPDCVPVKVDPTRIVRCERGGFTYTHAGFHYQTELCENPRGMVHR